VETTPAILLRRHRLTETSLIVTWLSPGLGRIKTVAKGALRPRNRLAGVLDLFHLCEIQIRRARSGDLHGLQEAVLVESFPGVRQDFMKVTLAAYAVELLERATEKETPVPELFDLLQRALRFLHANSASRKALRHFEAELARLLGIAEAGVPGAEALERVLQRLPPEREELMQRLPSG
jgi:DNA repair protein RecO (recombination protein O)